VTEGDEEYRVDFIDNGPGFRDDNEGSYFCPLSNHEVLEKAPGWACIFPIILL